MTRDYDERSALIAALRTLGPRQRAVIVLRYWIGLTEAETAATLGCAVGTVKSQASRALATLRRNAEAAAWACGGAQPMTRPSVTAQPPGPHSPPGLVASGLVGYLPWQVFVYRPGTHSAPRGQQCFAAFSAAFESGPRGVQDCMPVSDLNSTMAPVNFLEASGGTAQAGLGRVRSDVAYATLRLADGTVLTLHPVPVFGQRYIAFAAPMSGSGVASITAYSRTGQVGTAIPFNIPQGPAMIGAWQGPGQRVPPRVTKLAASGRADGKAWSVAVHLGPWGSCLVISDGSTYCVPIVSPLGTSILGWSNGSPALVYGSAATAVHRVAVTMSDGTTIQPRIVPVGNQNFFAFAAGKGKSAKRWAAYNDAGKVVASGPVTVGW